MRIWCSGLLLLGFVLLARAEDKKPESVQVPYRTTEVKHILVRAKINGKGPYNFILDTGAPALFVSTAVCKKLGVEADKDGWGTFDRLEIEGGAVVPKAKGKIADPFQLEGMNRMGLAGVELHGVIGYNIMAQFRVELDFTRDTMTWTKLKFDPGLPEGLEGKTPGGVDAMAGLAKLVSMLMGKRPAREINPRGFLGVELATKGNDLVLAAVLKDSPAAEAGLKVGDRITHVQGEAVKTEADLQKLTAETKTGDAVKLKIQRGTDAQEITVKAGKGL